MKIIKDGNINITPKLRFHIKRFECENCGCVFEMNDNEYQKEERNAYETTSYYARCPYCGCLVDKEIKIY